MPGDVVTMEFDSGDDTHWALRVGVVDDESFSRLEGDCQIDPCEGKLVSCL
jgi:hypothetical protein